MENVVETLIKQAGEKSPLFRKKWLYWVVQRKKTPDLSWLLENLSEALGVEYVRKQLETTSKED